MPKIKTNRGAAKRFKRTARGKIVRSKAYKSHLLDRKTRKQKRNLRQSTFVDASDARRISKLVPYL